MEQNILFIDVGNHRREKKITSYIDVGNLSALVNIYDIISS